MNRKLEKLVEMVVTMDGIGTAEVKKCEREGEITKEEMSLIFLIANVKLLDQKISCLLAKAN